MIFHPTIDIFSQKQCSICERFDCMIKIRTFILERIKENELETFTSLNFQDIALYFPF